MKAEPALITSPPRAAALARVRALDAAPRVRRRVAAVRRVGGDASRDRGREHPLYALRSFFLRRVSGERELTLPELFEESRRARVESTRSTRALGAWAQRFATWTHGCSRATSTISFAVESSRTSADCGVASHAPADARAVVEPSEALRNGLGELLGERVRVGRISLAPLATEESIVAELTAWRSGAGTQSGLFHASVEAIGGDGSPRDVRLFVKAKSRDTQSIDVAVALAGLASPTLREQVHRFRERPRTHAVASARARHLSAR